MARALDHVLPPSVDLDRASPPGGAGVMFAVPVGHITYAVPLASTRATIPLRVPAEPKLAAWFGVAALEPAGAAVVVVVGPGAAVVVVTAASAWSRMAWGSKTLSERLTASPKVRPPSWETATIGMAGTAFGAGGLATLRENVTYTTSSLPAWGSTAMLWTGRMFSAASPVLSRALRTTTVSHESPRLAERATSTAPPVRAASSLPQPLMAMYSIPSPPKASGAWMTPPWLWDQNGNVGVSGAAPGRVQVWPPSSERTTPQRRVRRSAQAPTICTGFFGSMARAGLE